MRVFGNYDSITHVENHEEVVRVLGLLRKELDVRIPGIDGQINANLA